MGFQTLTKWAEAFLVRRPLHSYLALTGFFLFVLTLAACKQHFGIYHTVRPGENLYRISKTYQINYQELAEINDLDDPSELRVGERVFVPGATRQRRLKGVDYSKYDAERKRKRQARVPKRRSGRSGGGSVKTNRGKFKWPVNGVVTSRYGMRWGNMHDGIDIGAKRGTPIRAAGAGKVIYSDNKLRGYGNLIIIKHRGTWSTVYAHNKVNYVKKNDFVERGEVIGKVGSTGRSTGPHLHFEVRKGRKTVNPLFYLPKRKKR